MTTSNSTVWELTRDQLIEASLRKLGVLNKGSTADATQLSTGQTALNGAIARFNTLGMPLWKRMEEGIPLLLATTTYALTGALKVTEVYLRSTTSSTQYKLEPKSEYDINSLPYSSTGVPTSWSFTPNLAEGGTLRIWPVPDSGTVANYSLRVMKQDEFDTFTASGETPDFPAYWTDALIYATAVALAPEYGIPLNDRKMLQQEMTMYLSQAQSYGDEDGSLFFAPEVRR